MNVVKKWYTYQKERFPVLVYGLYILAIVFGIFCFIQSLDKTIDVMWIKLVPMFIVAFLQFLMVRIIDEFKDYEDDCKYRPYRPVPRGLVSLKELKVVFIICVILQFILTYSFGESGIEKYALFHNPFFNFYLGLFGYLILMWVYFAIMSKSFFMKKFLDKHILIEVLLDELLMPIVALYLMNFMHVDWSITQAIPMLLLTYIISWIVEIARKVRCKQDEEDGVKTYTAVFGIPKAMMILFTAETLLMLVHTSILGINNILFTVPIYILVSIVNLLFAIKKNKTFAKITEILSNIYIILVYLSLVLLIL